MQQLEMDKFEVENQSLLVYEENEERLRLVHEQEAVRRNLFLCTRIIQNVISVIASNSYMYILYISSLQGRMVPTYVCDC